MKKITEEEIKEMFLSDDAIVTDGPSDPNAPTLEELKERIRSGELKVVIPSQLHILDLEKQVDQLMDALGLEAALVTDLTCISDFYLDQKYIDEAEETLGIHLDPSEYVYQAAQRLKDK